MSFSRWLLNRSLKYWFLSSLGLWTPGGGLPVNMSTGDGYNFLRGSLPIVATIVSTRCQCGDVRSNFGLSDVLGGSQG